MTALESTHMTALEPSGFSGHEQKLSVNIVHLAADHRRFLAAVHLSPLSLYARSPDLETAIAEYKYIYLPRLAGWTAASPPPPPLPIEVAWVWQLHKLDPTAYERDCVKAFGRVIGVHPGQNPFAVAAEHHGGAPAMRNGVPEGSGDDQLHATPVSISTDIAASAERQSVFLWQVRWVEYSEEAWLTDAETRYRMMLRLMGEDHKRFIVPTYDIDLMSTPQPNPKLNPEPLSWNPKPSTRKPSTPNPNPEILELDTALKPLHQAPGGTRTWRFQRTIGRTASGYLRPKPKTLTPKL